MSISPDCVVFCAQHNLCQSVYLPARATKLVHMHDNSGNISYMDVALTLPNQIILKLGWNILWANISDNFYDRYRSSLNMCIIDQTWLTFFEILKSFFKLEPWNLTQLDLSPGHPK